MATETEVSEAGLSDFSDLPPAEDEVILPPAMDLPPDTTDESDSVAAGVCPVCGRPIVRAPGSRGRLPKYHAECRPLSSVGGSSSKGGRSVRSSAIAEREATEAVDAFKKAMLKAIFMLAAVDKFDAFCMMAQMNALCGNLHAVCVRYPKFRREMLAMKGGGSIFGIAIAILAMLLPIVAHHGLIPWKKAAELLVNMPVTLFRMQQKMEEGEKGLRSLMADLLAGRNPAAPAPAANAAA